MYTRLQPILRVRDLVAEVEFYTYLGFHIQHESPGFTALAYGDAILFGLEQSEASDAPADSLKWQIGTSSIEAVAQRCAEAQLTIHEPIMLQPWGEWTLALQSPNGYRVIFEGPLNDSEQIEDA